MGDMGGGGGVGGGGGAWKDIASAFNNAVLLDSSFSLYCVGEREGGREGEEGEGRGERRGGEESDYSANCT